MDDCTTLNQIIINESISEEETKGNLTLSFKEWKSVTKLEGEHIKFLKIGPTYLAWKWKESSYVHFVLNITK